MDDTLVEAPQRFLEITFPDDAKPLVEVEPLAEPVGGKPRPMFSELAMDTWAGYVKPPRAERRGCRGRRSAPRRRTVARPRESHRGGRRRAVARAASRGGDSGDDGPGSSPPPELRFWRHPRYGNCTPNLLHLLVGVAV